MNSAAEITKALENVPSEIAVKVLFDVNARITDWISGGGKDDDPYIKQQVRFAKNIGNRFGKDGA